MKFNCLDTYYSMIKIEGEYVFDLINSIAVPTQNQDERYLVIDLQEKEYIIAYEVGKTSL